MEADGAGLRRAAIDQFARHGGALSAVLGIVLSLPVAGLVTGERSSKPPLGTAPT